MSRFRFRPNLEQIESRLVPAPVTAAVSGSLVLNNSSVNVSGVPVTLSGTSGGGIAVNATAVSNSTGGYTFQNVLPGTYTLSAGSAPGVIGTTTPQSVTVPAGTDVVKNLTYTGGLAPSALSLRSFLNVPNISALTFPTSGTGTAQAADRPNSAPTVSNQQAAITRNVSSSPASQTINLAGLFTDSDITNSEVTYNITNGGINYALKMTLLDTTAPKTVANFLDYVESGAYANALFTRNAKDFVLQGGGAKISTDGQTISPTTLFAPVPNEFSGASNLKYTMSMALSGGNPNSGTNQFFINTGNNAGLDSQQFTVFGKIEDAASKSVLDILNATPTINLSGTATAAANPTVLLDTLPLSNYTGTAATFPAGATRNNYMVINGITVTRNTERLSYTASSSNTSLVTATVQGSNLTLNYLPGQTGTSTITLTSRDKFGITTSQTFSVTVNAANATPTVSQQIAGQTQLLDSPANTIDLATKFADADPGDTLTFTADSSAPAIVSATVAGNQLTVTPQAGQTGLSTITVTATDPQGANVSQSFQVSLQPNSTPVVGSLLQNKNVAVNSPSETIPLASAFSDADIGIGDTLTYSASSSDTGVVTVSISGTDLFVTYLPGQTGSSTITVTATDSRNAQVQQSFLVTVA
jgi:cyclophilin family peptidyl-prolyl cis-trans isomerase